MQNALIRGAMVMAMAVLLAMVPVHAAWAHAQLLTSDPLADAVLAEAPVAVQLHFNEPVTPLAIGLVSADGSSLDLTAAAVSGASVTVVLPPGLGKGTRVLSWRVVSTDGHPIAGALVFSIGTVTGAAPALQPGDHLAGVALWVGKAMLFAALFFGIGGAVFAVVTPLPDAARRVSMPLCWLGGLLALVSLGLQGLDALGLPLTALAEGRVWAAGLSTSYGGTALLLVFAFVIAAVSLWLPAGPRRAGAAWLAGVSAALALALSGHASAAAPEWLTRPAVFLHIAGVLFWVGALLPLLRLLRHPGPDGARALARFSRLVPFAIAPLLVSGAILAIIQMGAPGPQWLTAYGAILAVKLALLLLLFALALWNRQVLTAPALAGEAMAVRRLRWSILGEILLVLLILGLVAGWRFTPPPRALVAAPIVTASEPIVIHLMDEQTMAMVLVSPGKAGPVVLDIDITDLEGMPMAPVSVSATLSAPTLGIETFKREAVALDGTWRIEDLLLPVPGLWQLQLDIRASRFQLITLREQFELP